MIGEIGGPQEAEAAEWARQNMKKPLIAYIAGLSAPKGKRMGHAGAIISAFGESAQEKVEILRDAGVTIVADAGLLRNDRRRRACRMQESRLIVGFAGGTRRR